MDQRKQLHDAAVPAETKAAAPLQTTPTKKPARRRYLKVRSVLASPARARRPRPPAAAAGRTQRVPPYPVHLPGEQRRHACCGLHQMLRAQRLRARSPEEAVPRLCERRATSPRQEVPHLRQAIGPLHGQAEEGGVQRLQAEAGVKQEKAGTLDSGRVHTLKGGRAHRRCDGCYVAKALNRSLHDRSPA